MAGKEARAGSRPTIADVAEAAGVARSTVSRAMNREHTFYRSDSAARIRAVAESLGYEPNPSAANLRRRQTNTIGVLVSRLTDTVMATLYEEIAAACAARGYHALVATTYGDPGLERENGHAMLASRVDGLILTTATTEGGLCAELLERGIPHVLALRAYGASPSVTGDDPLGGYLATRHLIDLGHREIGIVAGPDEAPTALGRREGYRRALAEGGLQERPEFVYPSTFSMESGEAAAEAFLAGSRRPTAVFAVNDNTAIGFTSVIQRAGLRIPQDLSVVGYNDIPLVARLAVPLTSVRVPFREIAAAAVDELLTSINGQPASPQRQRVLAPTVIPRASTGRPPGEARDTAPPRPQTAAR
ncbi:LacI family transcriptional regulator [Sinomonas cellulolyticus]|uniref:LacI family DNA-binding transcriptional regulator n=1 Tax=Sinomonas cellulolyticus TaxID=2801916 RepID=UPI0019AEB73D|nr:MULTISPECIES: LacI family DNA-binding transcriptional regulator [Sinomonas]GHG50075.1 LacI family transcriptional regulator [Sinomonas sp. KCTC 49339]